MFLESLDIEALNLVLIWGHTSNLPMTYIYHPKNQRLLRADIASCLSNGGVFWGVGGGREKKFNSGLDI